MSDSVSIAACSTINSGSLECQVPCQSIARPSELEGLRCQVQLGSKFQESSVRGALHTITYHYMHYKLLHIITCITYYYKSLHASHAITYYYMHYIPLHIITHVTQDRTRHPGFPAVQLRLTCDQICTGSESLHHVLQMQPQHISEMQKCSHVN